MVGIAQRYQLTATGRWDRILKRAGPISHDAATTGQGRTAMIAAISWNRRQGRAPLNHSRSEAAIGREEN